VIARLRGALAERGADSVVIECGGVGYDVTVSLATLTALPEVGAEVTVRVFTHATENKIALYGFATREERELFDRLITVKNVGPATATHILSGASSSEALAHTIAVGDVAALTRIRGVGKKTAELLVVELREKCERLLFAWGSSGIEVDGVPARRARLPVLDDVASALLHLGWRQAEADKAIARIAKTEMPQGATVEALLREALRSMPR
jgi:Holliday junction DNA helicase RuvA